MIRSLVTHIRIHCPSEYDKYFDEKVWKYSSWTGKRLRQRIKADILNGGREYKFVDWLREYNECRKNYQRRGDC